MIFYFGSSNNLIIISRKKCLQQGPFWPGVVVPIRVPSMGEKYSFKNYSY